MAKRQTLSAGELAQIPPNMLNSLPALQPPAGVQPNFVNPEDRGYISNSVATVLLCLMVSLFANRVYTKLFIIRKMGWDDLSCTIGFLGSIAMYIIVLWSTVLGSVGKHQWDVRLVEYLSGNFITTSAIMGFLAPLTLLFIKLTFFLLYFQVFRPFRWLRVSVYIGATLTCAFYGAASIAQLVFSVPRPGQTWLEPALSGEFNKADVLSVPLSAVGLGIDIALLVMPIAAVMRLQLPTKRKIGVLFIFMFGILACVGSLLSLYYRVVFIRSPDLTWNVMAVELVTLVEMFSGISCACMPAFSKMLHHHHPTLKRFRSVLSSRFASLRPSKSGDSTGRSGVSQSEGLSHHPVAKPDQGLYSQLEVELSSPQGASFQPTYELGQLQSVQTIIGKGRRKGASDDKIHLTHEIQQQQARMH